MHWPLIRNLLIASHLQSTACKLMYLAASGEAYLLQGIMRPESCICVNVSQPNLKHVVRNAKGFFKQDTER